MKSAHPISLRPLRLFPAVILLFLLTLCACTGGENSIDFDNAAATVPETTTVCATDRETTDPTRTTAEAPSATEETSGTQSTAVPEKQTEGPDETVSDGSEEREYVVNTNSGKFHYPSCASVRDIKPKNRSDRVCSRETLLDEGFVPCKRCNP